MKKPLFASFASLVLAGTFGLAARAQQMGNVWHIPRNAQPAGVPSMRNPLQPFVAGVPSVTFYNGSYSLDGNQIGGLFFYRRQRDANWTSLDLGFDTQNGNDKFWRATLPLDGFRPGEVLEYFFAIVFSDRATTYLHGTDSASQRTVSVATAQASPYTFRLVLPWPGGATAGYPSDPASRIHHWKEEAVVGNGYLTVMLDQNGTLYDIYYPSAGNRQGVSTANEGYRGPEEFPSCPLDRQANGQMNVIAGMGGLGIGGSIYWLKNQSGADYADVTQSYVPDNNVVFTTQRLTAPGNNIRVEQYDFCPVPTVLPVVAAGGRTNYGVYVKRFLLTNLEATPRTVDFYYDVNFNVNGGNGQDAMYFDTSNNRNTLVAYDNTAREVSAGGCGPNGYDVEYKPASYGGNYLKNLSVYFGTALKLITNALTGAGEPADGSWRDHTATDDHEGWLGKRVTLAPGVPTEIDVAIVGSWDDFAGATGTHDFWGRPLIDWFYANSMSAAQATTEAWWRDWLNAGVTIDFPGTAYDTLWKRSLLVSALHVDAASGSIIAGMHNGAYPFVWPRDGIYGAITFARAGHTNESYRFYRWLRDVASRDFDSGIGDKGFFYQKYSTDGYRIWTAPQVDETANVPWGVYYHYLITGDAAFLGAFWNLVYTSARASSEDSAIDGRLNYNDTFNLVDSMNCWEDSFGLFLYSNAAVERGLRDAARIADLLGQGAWASTFRNRAAAIKGGLDVRIDARVEPSDVSHLGLVFPYEIYAPTDPRMTNMIEWLHGRQVSGGFTDNLVEQSGDIAGLLRRYNHNVNGGIDNYWNGGPWFLATSWYGQYYARWQDDLAGKALVDVNRQKLDLLLAKLGPLGLGAEQIAPGPAQQKYPGFWLQAAWPNVWESHAMLLDQMMMFLDYRPGTNGVAFVPKLPTGWTSISFSNLLYRGQRFDLTVSETATRTGADLTKRTAGPLHVEFYLRIPAGVTPALLVRGTHWAAPTPADYDTNTGRVRLQGPLDPAAGPNPLFVTFGNADTDGDGLPDGWEAQTGLNPLVGTGEDGASGDPDGDHFTNAEEYAAGTDPRNASSLLKITDTSNGGRTLTWSSVSNKSYRVWATTNLSTAFTPLSGTVRAGGATTSYSDPAPAVPRKFYRVEVLP